MLYEKVPSLLFEYSISSASNELLASPRLVLETLGFKNDAISQTCEKKRWTLKVFSENKNEMEMVKKAFVRLKLPGLKLSFRQLRPSQWLTRWKTQWKPLSFTKTIDVVPYWYKGKYKTSKEIIYLDTLMSFGTGMHETTQRIAQLIEDNRRQLNSFLDIGTGTGILALAALKLGAKKVVAMDISPLSIEATKTNLKVNGLKANVFLGDIGKLPAKDKYQMVAANLITDDLLKNRVRIVNLVEPGGLLMISGISLDNLKRLQQGFIHKSLICRQVSKGKQWAAILYAKKMS
jgi:ribosomal protein L11 methyltransferase